LKESLFLIFKKEKVLNKLCGLALLLLASNSLNATLTLDGKHVDNQSSQIITYLNADADADPAANKIELDPNTCYDGDVDSVHTFNLENGVFEVLKADFSTADALKKQSITLNIYVEKKPSQLHVYIIISDSILGDKAITLYNESHPENNHVTVCYNIIFKNKKDLVETDIFAYPPAN
jgi:hypothetical protein